MDTGYRLNGGILVAAEFNNVSINYSNFTKIDAISQGGGFWLYYSNRFFFFFFLIYGVSPCD